jgi:hypothetical protein
MYGWSVGPAAVDRVEVQPRRAKVDQRHRVVLLLEAGRRIERDVVVDELPRYVYPAAIPAFSSSSWIRFFGFSRAAAGNRGSFRRFRALTSCLPVAPSAISASTGHTAGGNERNMRPNRPSKATNARRTDRHALPPPCAAGWRFLSSGMFSATFPPAEVDCWDRQDHTFTHAGVFTMTIAVSDL